MTNSYKSLLSEYAHKNGISIPVYNTTSCGEGMWISSATFDGMLYLGECSFTTKRAAEQYVAEIVMNSVNKPQTVTKTQPTKLQTDTPNLYIFIDLENIKPDLRTYHNNVFMFASTHSTINKSKFLKMGNILEIDSALSEAVDHFMTFTIASMLHQISKSQEIIIVSSDKSSAVVSYLVGIEGYTVRHFKQSEDLNKFLSIYNV